MNPAWIEQSGAVAAPSDHAPVGLDTEFMRRNTFYAKLALIQAAHADSCWLLDPTAYDAGEDVRALIGGRPCVMHSASEDLDALNPLIGNVPLRLFDTQIAAAMCGMGPGLGYQKLVARVCHIDIPKDETRSDWLQRPLTAGQLEYAAQDVTHLEELYEKLSTELQRRGRATWHAEDCARMVARARNEHTHTDPQPQRGLTSAAEWPAPTRARLRRVLQWRDLRARELDKPRPWILDDAHALALSQHPPESAGELFARVKGQRALRGPQRAELLTLLEASATPEELDTLAPTLAAPRGEAHHAVDAMRAAVKRIAAQLDLPPGLLCPRRLIEEFAVTTQWPAGLDGWRRQVLEADLTLLLPG